MANVFHFLNNYPRFTLISIALAFLICYKLLKQIRYKTKEKVEIFFKGQHVWVIGGTKGRSQL